MIPESSDSPERPRQKPPPREVEYVGAPTEYANRDEVPEAVSFLAKLFAGGAIAWGVLVAVIGLCALACVICGVLWLLIR